MRIDLNVLLKIAEVMVRELRFQFFTELIAKLYHFKRSSVLIEQHLGVYY